MTRLAALCVALFALGPPRAAAQFLSPGPLSRPHAGLEGDDKCGKCHAAGQRVTTELCIECHADLGRRLRARQGLHGREYRDRPCVRCHVEHLGADAPQIRWPGGRPEALDHALTGWPLRGAHARVTDCTDCHDQRNSRGHRTYLAAPGDCGGCHADPHRERFGSRCADCHDETAWHSLRLDRFDHAATDFPLRGEHGTLECRACHGEPARYAPIAHARCSDCHQDPHGGRFDANCASCHVETGWTDVDRIRREHPGTALVGGHARVACGDCHDRGNDEPPSEGTRCVSCHRPVHEASFGNDCASCHVGIRWMGVPRRVGLEAHGQTPFPLRGAHVEVECAGCHREDLPRARRYRGLAFGRCLDCHADPHGGEFEAREGGECRPCHDERAFRPTRFGVAEHATTPFPLEGRHEPVACGGCHGRDRPRASFRVARQACVDCHRNPHGTQFDAELAAGGCAHCHSTAGWDRPRIDHSTWPLEGAHARAACERCHHPSDDDRRSGRGASYRGAPRNCAGCHADPHAGQFRLTDPVRECDACHGNESFEVATFDHADRTGFVLEGRHAPLACEACHAPARLRNGDEARRYRLGYAACADCHPNPHAARARGGDAARGAHDALTEGVDCAACHTARGWDAFGDGAGAGFDHDRTGFPLRHEHARASCGDCHAPRRAATGACTSCHEDLHGGRLGAACETCHRPTSWGDTAAHATHARTSLPLTGAHALTDCTSCHRRAGPRTWDQPSPACIGCHADDYRDPATHPLHTGTASSPAFSTDCTECHQATSWVPAFVDPTRFGRTGLGLTAPSTHELRFPLRGGPHAGLACAPCHTSSSAPQAVRCDACHAHGAARLDALHGRPVARNAGACLGCHPGGQR